MEVYHESATATATARSPIRKYESVNVPPIRLVLDAILAHCDVGGTMQPGVRVLAEWAGVSRGLITDCLRQLDAEGDIAYDGRTIMLLGDPDAAPESDRSGDRSLCDESPEAIDQVIDRFHESDRSPDRSPLLAAVERTLARNGAGGASDRSPDRSAAPNRHPPHTPPMVHETHEQQQSPVVVSEESTFGGSGGSAAIDQLIDQHPAALVLAELGADDAIIADAVAARPDLTPAQVQQRWAYDQQRIAESRGRLSVGVFFHAIRRGQLAPPDPAAGVDWGAYRGREGFLVGDDAPSASSPQLGRDAIRERAERLTPPDISGQDFQFVLSELAMGASDDQVLDALALRQARRR